MVASSAESTASSPEPLSEADRVLLECEREHWGSALGKEAVVWRVCRLSLPAYYQRLYRLCQTPEAIHYDPVLARQIVESADHVTAKRVQRSRPSQEDRRG